MNTEKPIFLIGTGRCGSTAIHTLFSMHPAAAWLSDLCDRFPNHPEYNRLLMQIFSIPAIGSLLSVRFKPGENYEFWTRLAPGFRRPFRDLKATDLTAAEKNKVSAVMARMTTIQRNRLLLKLTGWPRIGFLNEIYPEAYFIHIVRDGRAVANSLLQVDFWDGWAGPDRWRWGRLSHEQNLTWENTGRSFVALAGLEWVLMLEAVREAKQRLAKDRFLEVRYEDFCSDKLWTARSIAEFTGLGWTDRFAQRVERFPVESRNYKWLEDLTVRQQEMLTEIQRPFLTEYGYLP